MSRTAETLTEKLHARADAKLRERIEKVFATTRREFTDGCCKSIKVKGGYIEGDNNGSKEYIVDAHEALSQLEELSFQMQRDNFRTDEVNDFLSRVEALESQFQEIHKDIQ